MKGTCLTGGGFFVEIPQNIKELVASSHNSANLGKNAYLFTYCFACPYLITSFISRQLEGLRKCHSRHLSAGLWHAGIHSQMA